MKFQIKTMIFAGLAVVLALTLGSSAAYATIVNPNYCLPAVPSVNPASTATTCYIALDELNTPPGGPPTLGYFVPGSMTITGAHTLHIEFHSGTVGGILYGFGDLFFNLANLSTVTAVSPPVFTTAVAGADTTYSVLITGPSSGPYQADGWGDFNVELNASNGSGNVGSSGSVTSISFDLTYSNSSPILTNLLTQQILLLNGHSPANGSPLDGGQSAAGHVYQLNPNGTALNNGNTFFAAWPNCADPGVPGCAATVPEPQPLALYLVGLIGLVVVSRRFQKVLPRRF